MSSRTCSCKDCALQDKTTGLIFCLVCFVYVEELEAEPNGVHYHQIILPQPVTRHLLDGFLLPSPTCRVWSVCCFHSWLIPLPLEPSGGRGWQRKPRNKRLAQICPLKLCFCYTNFKCKCLSHYLRNTVPSVLYLMVSWLHSSKSNQIWCGEPFLTMIIIRTTLKFTWQLPL